jgi:tetratricopeptide (TPR) repeat protein
MYNEKLWRVQSMFYLQVEITNYKQLKIIRPIIIEPLMKNIDEIISNEGGEKHDTLMGLYSFYSTFRETSLTVVNCAFKIYRELKAIAEKLYGFSIIISDSEWSDEELEINMRNFYYQIPQSDSLWLYEDKKNILEKHFHISIIKGLKLISEQNEEAPTTDERLKRFCRREAHIESICDTVIKANESFSENPIIHIRGAGYTGKEYNLDESLKFLCKDDNIPILFLTSSYSQNPLDPFLWSINNEIEENVSPYLDNGELDHWRTMSSEMKLFKNSWGAEQCSDFVNKDFIYLYTLYLKAYIKIRKENSLLPIIICKNLELWKKESIVLLNDLFQVFVNRDGLIPICISSDIQWIDEINIKHSNTIHFKPYTVEEFKSRINSAFFDIKLDEKEIFTLYKKSGGLTIPMFHSLLSYLESGYITETGAPSDGILSSFDDLTLKLLYLIYISRGLIEKEDYLDFFELRNVSRMKIKERMDHLYMLFFILGSEYPKSAFPDLVDSIKRKISEPITELINGFTNHLFSMWEKGKHLNIENLYLIILGHGQTGKSLQIYSVLLDRFLNNKQTELAGYYLSGSFYKTNALSIGENDALKNIVFSGKMRVALLAENYREVQAIISESEILKVHKKSAYSSHASLQHSIFMNSLGDYSRGLNLAKEALFAFQQAGDSVGEAKANIELATALLGQGKIRTSQDYFEISRRASFQSKDLLCQIRSSFFKALSDFIYGNIPMALRGVNDILSVAEKAGRREWQIMLIHLKGRILFDLGRYRDCEDNYKEGVLLAEKYAMKGAISLLKRWMARALLYNERYKDGIDILKDMDQTDESLFFLAEAAYFSKRFDKALEYINKAGSLFSRIRHIPGETPLWRDGFSSIEGYSLPRDSDSDVLLNQIHALKLYLMGITGDLNNAVMGFSELTSRYNTQNSSHYFYKYFYLYSSILPDSFNEDEKRLKILSNSVKLLQSRAGRFDDQKMKHSFLNYNYWNHKITEESIKRNFI